MCVHKKDDQGHGPFLGKRNSGRRTFVLFASLLSFLFLIDVYMIITGTNLHYLEVIVEPEQHPPNQEAQLEESQGVPGQTTLEPILSTPPKANPERSPKHFNNTITSVSPSASPSASPSGSPSSAPSESPSAGPSRAPTTGPTSSSSRSPAPKQKQPQEEEVPPYFKGRNDYDSCSTPPKAMLIVAGAQKAGTSAIWEVLKGYHPQFQVNWDCRPNTREAHYFNNRIFNYEYTEVKVDKELFKNTSLHSQIQNQTICDLRERYHKIWKMGKFKRVFQAEGKEIMPLEKTPNYLPEPFIPSLIKKIAPLAKVVVTLREPAARAFSAYKHFSGKDKGKVYKHFGPGKEINEFRDLVNAEVAWFRKLGVSQAPLLDEHYNASTTPDSAFALPAASALQHQERHYNGTLGKGMYAQQLRQWLKHFELGKDLMVVTHDELSNDPRGVFDKVQAFAGVRHHYISEKVFTQNYHDKRSTKIMTQEEKHYLQQFFKPYNVELERVLGLEFKGFWNYE